MRSSLRCPKRADRIDFGICLEALKKLHELDIIHGDSRPTNFLISWQKSFHLGLWIFIQS